MSQTTDTLRRFDASQGPRKVGPADGLYAELGGCGARFMIWGEESGGGFSLVEHPIPPRSLCAPLRACSSQKSRPSPEAWRASPLLESRRRLDEHASDAVFGGVN